MEMTPNEIVKSYREAKEKKKQIQILSELNACRPSDIKQILRDNGVQFPGPEPKKEPKAFIVTNKECTLPYEKIIPEFVENTVQERIRYLHESIETLSQDIQKMQIEEAELTAWLKKAKEV